MMLSFRRSLLVVVVLLQAFVAGLAGETRQPPAPIAPVTVASDRNCAISVSGELRAWHKVTLDLIGSAAAETDAPSADDWLAIVRKP